MRSIQAIIILSLFLSFSYTQSFDYQPINKKNGIYTQYKKSDGTIVNLKNTFFVKLKEVTNLDLLLSYYNIHIKKQYKDNMYLFESKERDLFKIMKQIQKEPYVLSVTPNSFKRIDIR